MNSKHKFQIDEAIFCKMVRLYGKTFNLPPLAAKIYGYLIFDFKREGLSFDEIVSIFSASKSSVSTSLCLLLSNNLIIDFNKVNDRKRYFSMNENFMKLRFVEIVDRLKEEIDIIEGLEEFDKKKSDQLNVRSQAYKSLLRKNIKNIEESLSKF